MHFHNGSSSAKRNKVMTPEQFKQVVEAITDGRYSWACVLILQFAGYNPVYFIPYRTYCRLVKENRRLSTSRTTEPDSLAPLDRPSQLAPSTPFAQIPELSYLEDLHLQEHGPEGGIVSSWFEKILPERLTLKLGLLRK
jgi:hypothetical protein